MIKHVYFWIGLFFALIILLPIFYGIAFFAEKRALDIAIFFFGCMVILLTLLFFILLFRNTLIRKITGRTEASYDEVYQSASGLARAVMNKDGDALDTHLQGLSSTLFAWYAWIFFYRWVLGFSVALLLAFGGFAGTVLLFEQNRKFDTQNAQIEFQSELLAVSLKDEIRSALYRDPISFSSWVTQYIDDEFSIELLNTSKASFAQCQITANWDANLFVPPSEIDIDTAVGFANNTVLKDRAIAVLNTLLKDDNDSVRFGALQALNRVNKLTITEPISFKRIALYEDSLPGNLHVMFEDSIVADIECEGCTLNFDASVIGDLDSDITLEAVAYSIVYGALEEYIFDLSALEGPNAATVESYPPISANVFYSDNLLLGSWRSDLDYARSTFNHYPNNILLNFDTDMIGRDSRGEMFTCDDLPESETCIDANDYLIIMTNESPYDSDTPEGRQCLRLNELCASNRFLNCRKPR